MAKKTHQSINRQINKLHQFWRGAEFPTLTRWASNIDQVTKLPTLTRCPNFRHLSGDRACGNYLVTVFPTLTRWLSFRHLPGAGIRVRPGAKRPVVLPEGHLSHQACSTCTNTAQQRSPHLAQSWNRNGYSKNNRKHIDLAKCWPHFVLFVRWSLCRRQNLPKICTLLFYSPIK